MGKNMKWNLIFPILVFAWLFSSCQTATAQEKTIPTILQAAKPTLPLKTDTPRAIATVTPTPDIAATVIAIGPPKMHSSFLSTDSKWKIEIVSYDCVKVDPRENADANAVEVLKLIDITDQTETIIDSQLLNCGGVGAFGLGGLFWSPNNQYFYYTDAREGVPDGLCGYWARPIKRVNVDTERVDPVGGGHLSPDKTKLAFWQDNEIVIWSLDEGEIARIPAMVSQAFKNEIAWSPDGQSLVYLQTENDCTPFGKSYVTRLDLSDMTQNLLFGSEEASFTWLAWDIPDRISLTDDTGTKWMYNLASKELKPIQ
jgi:Periplasmic component of the Tol biopolymer transport system